MYCYTTLGILTLGTKVQKMSAKAVALGFRADTNETGPWACWANNKAIPLGSMYGVFCYIWLMFMVNVGKYAIHGCYGI